MGENKISQVLQTACVASRLVPIPLRRGDRQGVSCYGLPHNRWQTRAVKSEHLQILNPYKRLRPDLSWELHGKKCWEQTTLQL